MDWAKSGFLCSGPACLCSTALDENFAGAKYFLSGFASTESGKNGVRFCIIPLPSSLSCLATTADCSCWLGGSFGRACDGEIEEPIASQVTGQVVGDDRAGGCCTGGGGGGSGGSGGGGGVEAREDDDCESNPDDLWRALLSFLRARA